MVDVAAVVVVVVSIRLLSGIRLLRLYQICFWAYVSSWLVGHSLCHRGCRWWYRLMVDIVVVVVDVRCYR